MTTAAPTIEGLEPGLYLGLPDDIYFEDPAISYSGGIKPLLRSPAEYWLNSPANPTRDPVKVETDKMAKGKLFHCLLLEPEKFDERYFIMPGGRWSDSKKMVGRSDFMATQKAVQVIKQLKDSDRLFDRRYGYPEVVAVWPDPRTGVMCRAKHDFFCWEWTPDYKTVDSIAEDALKFLFRKWRYPLQHAHYVNGRKVLREMIREGKADFFGDFSDEFKAGFMAGTDDFFLFVCQQREEPYTAIPLLLHDTEVSIAQEDCGKALARFVQYRDQYGMDQPWPSAPDGVKVFSTLYGFEQE